ncbi:hypothetical protein D9756_002137 [Leucocoprinus leucothites]|uniref:Uncharacterized protein n=1 Tax=Leucocoprinus leucothites TaxID=201217 RepID=A0A8H5GBY8_9AGAR|nr:hypothetical protein D9756_002137 [Leucoagaricus leucothites]
MAPVFKGVEFVPSGLNEMVNLSDPLIQIKAASGICTAFAVLSTWFRLYIRARRRQLWIEDAWAAISMGALGTQMAAVFIEPSTSTGVVRYYIMSNTFYATIWCARLSILFSIIRIRRKFLRIRPLPLIAAAFLIVWFILTAQIYWECETRTEWKRTTVPQCKLSSTVPICQLITDVISDSILVFHSIKQFMDISDKKLRLRLILIFGSCIMTTAVSACHAMYLLRSESHAILISAFIENAISLIVCNIPVAVTAAFKLKEEEKILSSPDQLPSLLMPSSVDHWQDDDISSLHLRKQYTPSSPL